MSEFLIYTREQCPYCTKAKSLITMKSMSYTEYKIGDDITRDEFISRFPDQKTVPLIFYGDEQLGGFTELRAWFDSRVS